VHLSPSLLHSGLSNLSFLLLTGVCSTLFDLPDTSATTSSVSAHQTVSRASRETLLTVSLYNSSRSWALVIFHYQTALRPRPSSKLLYLLRKLNTRIDFEELSNTRNHQIYLTKFENQPCGIEIYDIASVWRHPNRSLETTNNLPTHFGSYTFDGFPTPPITTPPQCMFE
jgi:hypothetical protein